MGLPKTVVEFLVGRHARRPWRGPVLTLGVQEVTASREETLEIFARGGVSPDPAVLERVRRSPGGESVTADELFGLLGLEGCQSLDKFAGEGASIIHDLCHPVPAPLVGRFGLVVDGGTLEHVFDVAGAFRNVIAMVRSGGSVLHVSPVSGWDNHGFFSINPKLLARTYAGNGFVDAEAHLLHVPRDTSRPAWLEWCGSLETPFATDSARESLLVVFTAVNTARSGTFSTPVDSHIAANDGGSGSGRARLRALWRTARGLIPSRAEAAVSSRPDPQLSQLPEAELLIWKSEAEFRTSYARASAACGHDGPEDRYYVLKELLLSRRSLDADTAECGVYYGLASFLLCHYAGKMSVPPGFRHHCFDSFEGMSEPRGEDAPSREGVRAWRGGDMRAPLERVQLSLGEFPHVQYHRGWVPACFDDARDLRFAFVHVDVDLYEPTRDAFAFFYPRLVRGGIILCDDYGFHTCPGATRAIDEFVRSVPEPLVRLPTGQAYLVKEG